MLLACLRTVAGCDLNVHQPCGGFRLQGLGLLIRRAVAPPLPCGYNPSVSRFPERDADMSRANMEQAQGDAPQGDRFRILFEHSSDAHLIFDETGITDCNDATIKLLKAADRAQVLALHPAMLSPEYQPDGRRSLDKAVEMDTLARARLPPLRVGTPEGGRRIVSG